MLEVEFAAIGRLSQQAALNAYFSVRTDTMQMLTYKLAEVKQGDLSIRSRAKPGVDASAVYYELQRRTNAETDAVVSGYLGAGSTADQQMAKPGNSDLAFNMASSIAAEAEQTIERETPKENPAEKLAADPQRQPQQEREGMPERHRDSRRLSEALAEPLRQERNPYAALGVQPESEIEQRKAMETAALGLPAAAAGAAILRGIQPRSAAEIRAEAQRKIGQLNVDITGANDQISSLEHGLISAVSPAERDRAARELPLVRAGRDRYLQMRDAEQAKALS